MIEEKLEEPQVLTDAVSEVKCDKCGCDIDIEGIDPFLEVECPDCSNRVVVPAKLGNFLLTSLIGKGGMGGVYLGIDETLGRHVAIKVMLKSLGDDPQFVESFKREAQAAARINHPNIVQIYSFGTEKGQPYIVMELISGKRFDKLVDSGKPLDQGFVMQVGCDIAEALNAANEAGLLHGDIKPENILLDEKLNAKLVDFGIASFANQSAGEGIWGTPYYIAPEKIRKQKTDARSDMYSLGATLYQALAGRPPFEGKTPIEVIKARLNKDPEPLGKRRKEINKNVEKVVMRMLQQAPNMRHPTYQSLISDLHSALKELGGRKKSLSALEKTGAVTFTRRIAIAPKKTGESPTKTSSGKIIIRKKPSVIFKQGATSPSLTASIAALPEKPRSKAPLVVILILLLLGLVTGGVFYILDHNQKKMELRRELLAYQQTVTSITNKYNEIHNIYEAVVALSSKANALSLQVSNAVKTVLNDTIELHAPKATLRTPDPLSAQPESQTPAEAQPKTEPNAPIVDEEGREMPAGLAPPPHTKQTDTAPKTVLQDAPAEPTQPETTPTSVTEKEPELKQLARKALEAIVTLNDNAADAEKIDNEAKVLADEGIKSAKSDIAAEKFAQIITALVNIREIESKAKATAAIAQELATKMKMEANNYLKEQEEKRKALEEAEKIRKEKEALQQREEERNALIESEILLANSAWEGTLIQIKENNYSDPLKQLQDTMARMQTQEGKQTLQVHIDKCNYLRQMKVFLIQQLSKTPMPWGWIQGRQEDILGASDKGITLKNQVVPWKQISIQQMLHLLRTFTKSKAVSLKELTSHNIAAAIYCHINGGDAVAREFIQQAVSLTPETQELAERLMPDLQ